MSDDRKPEAWDEIRKWRKARRAELIERRAARSPAERQAWNQLITAHLLSGFDIPAQAVIGFCWPYKGEFDARHAVRRWRERGVTAALPEVIAYGAPLRFRTWWPGAPMRCGVYDIPFPADTPEVLPDIAIVPMNGFDDRGYRLGYGGGFFDRTLAGSEPRTVSIGVSYEMLRLPTIEPQPHDIPMDFIVTEAGIYAGGGEALTSVDASESRRRTARLMTSRRLPRAAYASNEYSSPVCYADQFPGYWGEDPTGGNGGSP